VAKQVLTKEELHLIWKYCEEKGEQDPLTFSFLIAASLVGLTLPHEDDGMSSKFARRVLEICGESRKGWSAARGISQAVVRTRDRIGAVVLTEIERGKVSAKGGL
jgi:hypothetical protein